MVDDEDGEAVFGVFEFSGSVWVIGFEDLDDAFTTGEASSVGGFAFVAGGLPDGFLTGHEGIAEKGAKGVVHGEEDDDEVGDRATRSPLAFSETISWARRRKWFMRSAWAMSVLAQSRLRSARATW